MTALVVIGSAMAIWVTAMLYMERRHARRHVDTIDAADTASNDEATEERVMGIGKISSSKL